MKSQTSKAAAKSSSSGSKSNGKGKQGEIHLQRVYDPPPADGGACFLVDRLWPRGIKKSALPHTEWLPDVAPSNELRKWFGHEPAKWAEFRRRYRTELKNHPEPLKTLCEAAKKGAVTLLFGAKDMDHNQAVVLKEVLEGKSA